MWDSFANLLAKIFNTLASLFVAKKWGESNAQKEQLEADLEAKKEDEKIISQPFVDRPFGRMRRRKQK